MGTVRPLRAACQDNPTRQPREFAGVDHFPFVGDVASIVAAVEEFVRTNVTREGGRRRHERTVRR
jgi:hypothetical protein